jgi:hypothetical protein
MSPHSDDVRASPALAQDRAGRRQGPRGATPPQPVTAAQPQESKDKGTGNPWATRAFMAGGAAITLVWVAFLAWLVTKLAHIL